MAYLTIHRLDGDPDELLRRKRATFDPAVGAHAGAYGARFSVTARTAQGLVVVNVWESPEAAADFTQLPEIQRAQRESGLPLPSSFERYTDAQLDEYQR
jgi:hypothetical protein